MRTPIHVHLYIHTHTPIYIYTHTHTPIHTYTQHTYTHALMFKIQ